MPFLTSIVPFPPLVLQLPLLLFVNITFKPLPPRE